MSTRRKPCTCTYLFIYFILLLINFYITCRPLNINIGTTDKVYRAVFKLDNIVKVIPGNYSVDISSKGISHFQSDEIEYWIAIESTSTF